MLSQLSKSRVPDETKFKIFLNEEEHKIGVNR